MSSCSFRALWILNAQDAVVFSRRFAVVEKRWRVACERENKASVEENLGYKVQPLLPTDPELASAFTDRKNREGSARGFGIRISQSAQGSDSWLDDPISRHIITLNINKEEGDGFSLWPLVLHIKGGYFILVLPLVEPQQFESYERMCRSPGCGNSGGEKDTLSSLLLNLPCITGAFMVAHTIGDIITGDLVDPEVVVSSVPSVGGLLDSLTGSIGISSISTRTKPVAAPVAASVASGASVTGAAISDTPQNTSRPIDKDVLRTFISSSMPFGTPLDLNFSNISAIKTNGFSSIELPPADIKQPAWKPYLYKGKQRVSEQGVDKQALMFSPPLGNFILMRYQASCGLDPPVKGFYQLSMVSEDEGAFLFKLRLMEGYKGPLSMDFCTIVMPFPRRRLASFDGNPSTGIVSMTEHSLEWKIITSGRGITGKSIEATFSGTVTFFPSTIQRLPTLSRSVLGSISEEDSDVERDSSNNIANIEEHLTKKMNKNLQPVDLEEPLCWQAYNYAKVSFKILGGTLSGLSIDPKSVSIYPAVKAPVEISMQASSGDYILWNTLGSCPRSASPKDQ